MFAYDLLPTKVFYVSASPTFELHHWTIDLVPESTILYRIKLDLNVLRRMRIESMKLCFGQCEKILRKRRRKEISSLKAAPQMELRL